jgi:C4-dicarboxylate-specific signal transduction histidine kinase
MEEKRIELTAEQDGDEVVLRLADSGPGLREPEKVFQPFQQGADAVGLGLYVSRAIVRACEGELVLGQTGPGCTMMVRLKVLPAVDADATAPAAGQGVDDD